MAELVNPRGGTANVRAICDCGTLMHRRVSLSRLAETGFGHLVDTERDGRLVDSPQPPVNCHQKEDA
jgi:hypothetical protein